LTESQRLQGIRETNNLSRTEFGQLLGLSSDHVGKIERGEREASRNVLAKIVKLFPGITIDFILTGRSDTSSGIAQNQSFVGANSLVNTQLAKTMLQNINQLAIGIQTFDGIATNYNNLKALERKTAALSIGPDTREALIEVKRESRRQTA